MEKSNDEECASSEVFKQKLPTPPGKVSASAPHLHPYIVLTGFILTLVTGLPNLKIASASSVAANMGIVSNALFGLGGVLGGCKKMWVYLLPGIMLQITALSYLCFSTAYDERYRYI